jgi:anti-sigma regulatory factor (Ser/Thr protein kinase)
LDPSERVLPPQPASVGEARRAVRALLAAAGRDDLTDTAELLVSEVVTNALLHAGTDIVLRATLDGTTLRVEVGDGSPHLPVRRRYGATSGTGRGLLMLEQLVDDWGVSRQGDGKTVWFLLGRGDLDPVLRAEPDAAAPGHRSEGPTVQVRLRNVPLLLHAAWQEHAEALLREFLLASLDDEGDVDAIEVHARCTDAIAVVSEQIPRIDVDVQPDRLMAGATEPNVSREELELPVPAASVPHFETLDRTIESSLDLSRTGRTLTPPTQPEVQVFRRWLCEEVLGQAVGADPRPWTVEGDQADLVWHQELDWDPAEVVDASSPRVAADAANRIVAVNDAALELLGYDDPGHRPPGRPHTARRSATNTCEPSPAGSSSTRIHTSSSSPPDRSTGTCTSVPSSGRRPVSRYIVKPATWACR